MSYRIYKHLMKSNYFEIAETVKSLTKKTNYDSKKPKKETY